MPDYKQLYIKSFKAMTKAERLIDEASALLKVTQQECEDVVIESDDTPITLIRNKDDTSKP